MTNSEIVTKIDQLLATGQAAEAAELAIGSIAELAGEPRLILRVLEALDKGRHSPELLALFAKLEERDIVLREALVFALRAKFRATDYLGSLQIVERILERSNGHIEALRTGGRIGNLTRDDSLALHYWEPLARVSPNDPEAALQSARIRMRRHQHAAALDWARRAVEVQPDAVEPLRIAVGAGIAVGWPEDCDELLARLWLVDRDRAERTASQLAAILDAAPASRALSVLLQHFPSDETLLEIVDKACSRWLVAGREGELLALSDVEAAAFYYALRRVRPDDADATRALERLSLPSLVAMREAFGTRDFAGAIEHGTIATRIDPDCIEAWQTVAHAQFGCGEIASAREAFRRAAELSPEDDRLWLAYGLILNQAGEPLAALAAFRNAQGIASDPETKREAGALMAALHPALVRDAHQAIAEGRIDDAWQHHDAALAMRADGTDDLRRDLLHATREKIRELWKEKSNSVVPLCRRYLAESPNDSYVLKVLGRTLMGLRAYSEALTIWERLCAWSPSDGHFHLQVARCCRFLNLVDKGVTSAEEALRRNPGLREATEVAEFLKSMQRQSEARL